MFLHELKSQVSINGTKSTGSVTARIDYSKGTPNNYLVEHIDGSGDLVERWYTEDQLSAAAAEA